MSFVREPDAGDALTGTIDFLQWDSNDNLLKMTAPGIIPVPEDYVTALRMDYVRFLNAPTSPVIVPAHSPNPPEPVNVPAVRRPFSFTFSWYTIGWGFLGYHASGLRFTFSGPVSTPFWIVRPSWDGPFNGHPTMG